VKYPGQASGERVREVVSLTDFPDAVEATVDGAGDPTAFVTDGPVVATAHGLDDPVQERARKYVDDLTPYTATARAVFEGAGEDVSKYVTWRDEERTIRVRDAQTAWVESRDDAGKVDAAFGGVADAGVKGAGESADELSAASRQQLEDLGYM
jgi:arylsulfatase